MANVSKTVWTNCNIPYHGARSRAITTATASWLRLIASTPRFVYAAPFTPDKVARIVRKLADLCPVDRFRKYRLLRGQVPRYSLIFIDHPPHDRSNKLRDSVTVSTPPYEEEIDLIREF